MDKNWVYFGPFRPKIDPKMVSYYITFTKKWFLCPTANLNRKNLSTNSPWGFEANLDTIDPN